jgi:hypothetical protein
MNVLNTSTFVLKGKNFDKKGIVGGEKKAGAILLDAT